MGQHIKPEDLTAQLSTTINRFGVNWISGNITTRDGAKHAMSSNAYAAKKCTREALEFNAFFQYCLRKQMGYVMGTGLKYKPHTLDPVVEQCQHDFWNLPGRTERYQADTFGQLLPLAYQDYQTDGETAFVFFGKKNATLSTNRVKEIGIVECDNIKSIQYQNGERKYTIAKGYNDYLNLTSKDLVFFANTLKANHFRGFPPLWGAAEAADEYVRVVNYAIRGLEIRASLVMVVKHLHSMTMCKESGDPAAAYRQACEDSEVFTMAADGTVINLHGSLEDGNVGDVQMIDHNIGANDIDKVAQIVRRYTANMFDLSDILLGYPDGANRASSSTVLMDNVRSLKAKRNTPTEMYRKAFALYLTRCETAKQRGKKNYVVSEKEDGTKIMGTAKEVANSLELVYSPISFLQPGETVSLLKCKRDILQLREKGIEQSDVDEIVGVIDGLIG